MFSLYVAVRYTTFKFGGGGGGRGEAGVFGGEAPPPLVDRTLEYLWVNVHVCFMTYVGIPNRRKKAQAYAVQFRKAMIHAAVAILITLAN